MEQPLKSTSDALRAMQRVRWHCSDPAVSAEDVSQTTFLKLLETTSSGGSPPASREVWRKFRCEAGTARSRGRVMASRREPIDEDAVIGREPNPVDYLIEAEQRREDSERLRHELAGFSEARRRVFRRRYRDGLSTQQIAQDLSMPLGTVTSHLKRGREELRGLLLQDTDA